MRERQRNTMEAMQAIILFEWIYYALRFAFSPGMTYNSSSSHITRILLTQQPIFALHFMVH